MKDFLEKIVQDPALESRWLHTLSLLEYIGARKIGKTFAHQHPSLEVLEHHADETRHAYAFKRLAVMVSGETEPGYLCEQEAIAYFQMLDRSLSEWIAKLTGQEDSFQSYLIVTTLIERRAIKLYPLYSKMTHNQAVRDELIKVIGEEANHRVSIEEKCLKILNRHGLQDFEQPEAIESELFQKMLDVLQEETDVMTG